MADEYSGYHHITPSRRESSRLTSSSHHHRSPSFTYGSPEAVGEAIVSPYRDASVETHVTSHFGYISRFVLRRTIERATLADALQSLRRRDVSAPPSLFVDDSPLGPASQDVPMESLRSNHDPLAHPEPHFGTLGLIAALASLVMCSRYGGEEVVSAGGPLWTLIGLTVLPVVWYLPTALVVAELSNAVPCNAGLLMWVNVACKPFWTFLVVFLTLVLNVIGLAVASALVTAYLGQAFAMRPAVELLLRVAVLSVAAIVNARTVSGLTLALQVITVATTVPFVALTYLQFSNGGGVDWNAVTVVPAAMNVPLFLTYLAFTHSGVENIGSLVEDIRAPERTMVRASIPAMFGSFAVYVVPFACAISAVSTATHGQTTYAQWQPGYWSQIANFIGGPFWAKYVAWAGVLSRFSSLLGTVACAGRQLAGMGAMSAFPRPMSDYLAQYDTHSFAPVNSILVASLAAAPFTVMLSVNDLVVVFQVLSSVRILIAVYGAFFLLRRHHPTLPRPYRLPLGETGAALALMPSIIFVVAVGCWGALASPTSTIVCSVALAVSVIAAWVWSGFLKTDGLAGAIEVFNIHDQPVSEFLPELNEYNAGARSSSRDVELRSVAFRR